MDSSIGRNLIAPRRSGARRWLVIISLVLHAGVIGTYVVMGMMRIERLTPEKSKIRVATMPKIDMGAPPSGGTNRPKDPKPVPPKERTQPPKVEQIVPDKPTPDETTGDPNSNLPPGDNTNPIGPPSDDPPGNCPPGETCVQGDPKPTPTKTTPPPPAATIVPPNVITALRTDGDPQIHPPDTAQNAMIRDGKTKVFGIVQLCLDTSGRINKTKMLKSTGYPAYDNELLAGVRSWRYDPHRVNGTAVPVCSTVHFNYSIR